MCVKEVSILTAFCSSTGAQLLSASMRRRDNITNDAVISACVCCAMIITIAHAQVPFFGHCPDVPTMSDFEPDKYLGKWYEAERYFAVFEFGGKCVTAEYGLADNGDLSIVNRQTSAITGMDSMIEGVGNVIDRSDVGKLGVQFPSLRRFFHFTAPYWILYTDYDNYALVWSCNNFGPFGTKNAWILTRTRQPSLIILEQAYKILDQYGIDRQYFIRTDQRNCPANY